MKTTLAVGNKATVSRVINSEDIEIFAGLSRDRNRLHFDKDFASATIFGKPVAHGLIGAALISGALTRLMGDGNIWLSASLSFDRPVFPGDELNATLEVVSLDRRGVADITVKILNQNGEQVIGGQVKSMNFVARHKI